MIQPPKPLIWKIAGRKLWRCGIRQHEVVGYGETPVSAYSAWSEAYVAGVAAAIRMAYIPWF